jgi:2-dehydropantoate 2-reductase
LVIIEKTIDDNWLNMKYTVQEPKIVIIGAGSIGCYLGGCLIASGASVTLIGRERMLKQVERFGLRLTDWQGRYSHVPANKINFVIDNEALTNADFVLVTVKSGDTKATAEQLKSIVNRNAVIVSFQNGIHNAAVISNALPKHKVLKAMVPFNVINKGEGDFHCGTEGHIAIEDLDSCSDNLCKTFYRANIPVDVYDNINGVQWSKLVLNLNNAVNALSGVPLVQQLSDKTYRKVMVAIIEEALLVLKIADIKLVKTGKVIPAILPLVLSLPTWLFTRVASGMLKIDPAARSSMYDDLQLRRKTEIDFLNGEIVNLGVKYNVHTPVNSVIVGLIKDAEFENAGTPLLSAKALLKLVSGA